MLKALKSILAGRENKSFSAKQRRRRLVFETRPKAIYAIGDVHGCLTQLEALEEKIYADASQIDGEKWIMFLGDYIDRGPASANVLDHLMSPVPQGFQRICLAGNHEEAFLGFVDSNCRNDAWLSFGGEETLASYGLYPGNESSKDMALKVTAFIPSEHLDLLRDLPEMVVTPGFCFVHAGINPAIPLEEQSSQTLLWSRPSQFDWTAATLDFIVVHGHTPVAEPEHSRARVNVDIGAFASGRLAAAKIDENGEINFLFSN